MITKTQRHAVLKIAHLYKWDELSTGEVGLLVWTLFQYYVLRLKDNE